MTHQPPRVSVIVAVYEPGPQFDGLVESLLAQTLPVREFEVLLCDDGSGPQAQARLAALAAEHPHFRVLTLEHSGWPGTPRNAGIEAAAGRYLFFADDDDRFGAEALARLADFADRHGSDVVLGKVVGLGRPVSRQAFAATVPRARLGVDPLLDLLTPHKLFRASFVRRQRLRFPDGKVRLEDHQFVLGAYFAAGVISIMADYPCYYWRRRDDRKSISGRGVDPGPYFEAVGWVLDIVEKNTPPGPERDALLQHWYRGKVLKRLGGERMLRHSARYREAVLAASGPFVRERFAPEVDAHLPFPMRVRSALLRAGRTDELLTLAMVEAGMRARAQASAVAWTAPGRLTLTVEAQVVTADGTPLGFEGGRWQPPAPIAPDVLTDDVLDASRDLAGDGVQILVRDQADGATYPQPTVAWPGSDGSGGSGGSGGLRVRATIDPRTARAGRPLGPDSELVAYVTRAGWQFTAAVRVRPAELRAGPIRRIAGDREYEVRRREGRIAVTEGPVPGRRERLVRAGRRIAREAYRRVEPGVPEPGRRIARALYDRLAGH